VCDAHPTWLLHKPPPKVIHIKFGDMKIREMHQTLSKIWGDICALNEEYKLFNVYKDHIEGID